jgi:sialate O-acetylesterase
MASCLPSLRRPRLSAAIIAGVLTALACAAEVKLPAVFGDRMVLQRDRPIPVWGWDAPGTEVTVKLGEASAAMTVGKDGRWRFDLPALPAGGPLTLTVTGSSTVVCKDVLLGDVWVCSGQSNMEWGLGGADGGDKDANEAVFLKLRLLQIPKVASPLPQDNVAAAWQDCTPANARGFSAVGYYFGRELLRELEVPIGLINTSWGGTRIEPWTPPAGFAAVPKLAPLADQVALASPASAIHKQRLAAHLEAVETWMKGAREALKLEQVLTPRPEFPGELLPLQGSGDPCALYNGMVQPLVPYGIRGAIWYQGESNLRDGGLYYHKMQALVKGWRAVWNQGDFPFYWVQLAPYNYGGNIPRLLPQIWEAQAQALDLPNTGMAVISDIGNVQDIHPRNKREVGRRLSLIALANTYDRTTTLCSGPVLKEWKADGNRLRLSFTQVGDGLRTRDGKPPTWFEIGRPDGSFAKADAVIEGTDQVILTAAGVTAPSGARFAWDQSAEPNLINSAGLPTSAFRAGDTAAHNELEATIPLAKGFQTVYRLDLPEAPNYSDQPVAYAVDNADEITQPIERIAYCLELQKAGGPLEYVFVSMDAFSQEARKIGIPTAAAGVLFQQDVKRLAVASNVQGVPTGDDLGDGSIEFWPSNYGPRNARPVPGASNEAFDFGDGDCQAGVKGHACMQIHLPSRKQTLLALNRWGPPGPCEMGLGNNPEGQPDWTFTANAAKYTLRRLTVLVRIDR